MVTVYIHECKCKVNTALTRLRAVYGASNVKVIDTRINKEKLPEHERIALELELSMDRLEPVVHINDNGENIYKPLADV